jgi:hypothetical protein
MTRALKVLPDDWTVAFEMRRMGCTLKTIGECFGVSAAHIAKTCDAANVHPVSSSIVPLLRRRKRRFPRVLSLLRQRRLEAWSANTSGATG